MKVVCPKCNKRLIRVHNRGEVRCNSCNELIVEDGYDNQEGITRQATKCPNAACGFYPIFEPDYNTVCEKCGMPVLNSNPKNQ